MKITACSSETRLPAIVLAAGLSTRMGDFKPVMKLGGEMLVRRVLTSMLESRGVKEVVVVTGHRRMEVEVAVEGMAGVRTTFNPAYAEGEMLSSLLAGLCALEAASTGCRGFVLAFADQPAVAPETIGALVECFYTNPGVALVLPTHLGKRGHPIIVSWELVAEIRTLGAGETLRKVVHAHHEDAALVPVSDAFVLEDLDTPEDFARAEGRYRNC